MGCGFGRPTFSYARVGTVDDDEEAAQVAVDVHAALDAKLQLELEFSRVCSALGDMDTQNDGLRRLVELTASRRLDPDVRVPAALGGQRLLVFALLIQPRVVDSKGNSRLWSMFTSVSLVQSLVVALLEAKACPNALAGEPEAPLFACLRQRTSWLLDTLVEHGADVHARASDGRRDTFVQRLFEKADAEEKVRSVLDQLGPADFQRMADGSYSPDQTIVHALVAGRRSAGLLADVLSKLTEADRRRLVNARDSRGLLPLDLALFPMPACACTFCPLFAPCTSSREAQMQRLTYLLDAGANPEPLSGRALGCARPGAARLLLLRGADATKVLVHGALSNTHHREHIVREVMDRFAARVDWEAAIAAVDRQMLSLAAPGHEKDLDERLRLRRLRTQFAAAARQSSLEPSL